MTDRGIGGTGDDKLRPARGVIWAFIACAVAYAALGAVVWAFVL